MGRRRFLLDENVPLRFRVVFSELSFDAEHLSLAAGRGGSDAQVVDRAVAEDRMVVTFDLDFGRLYYFHRRGQVGVLLLRLGRLSFPAMETRLREFLGRVDIEARGLQRALIVLEPHRYRVLQ